MERHGERDRLAMVLPAFEVPLVGKTAALGGLYGLDRAGTVFEKDALVIWLFDQRKAVPLGAQAGVAGQEFLFGDAKMGGDGAALVGLDIDVAGPSAAISAALALKEHSWWRRSHR